MLKISRETGSGRRTVLKLEGTVGGPWVQELQLACDEALAACGGVILDLAAVPYVDRAGQQLLDSLRSDPRVEFARTSAFVAEMLKGGAA